MLHGVSAVLNLCFSLLQTLVLARTLDVAAFSQLVVLVSAGLFLAPVYQLVARGNYALFAEVRSRSDWRDHLGPAADAILLTQLLSVLASVVASLLLAAPESFLPFVAFSLYINLSNSWYNEFQTSFFMCDQGVAFTYVSLARRACSYVTLSILLYTHSFALFCSLMGLQAVAFHVLVVWVHRAADVSSLLVPRGLGDLRALIHHLWRSAAVVSVIGAEWVAFSFPYLVFTGCFGASVELVILDTGLKLVRVALTFVRALAEAALPKLTIARSAHEWLMIGEESSRLAKATLAIALPIACVIGFFGNACFRFLLGAEFPIPHEVGLPFAVSTVFASLLQLALLLVGFFGRGVDMRRLLLSASAGALVMVIIALVDPHSLALGLWALAAHLLVCACGGMQATGRALSVKNRG